MAKEYEYKGQKYWVKIEPVLALSGETVFIAYVGNEEPGALFYGISVKAPDGQKVQSFRDEFSALTNAHAVIRSEIDSRA